MKKSKRLKNLLAVVTFCCSLLVTTALHAAEPAEDITFLYGNAEDGSDSLCDIMQLNNQIAPRYNTVCGNLPYHKMTARGFGTVYLSDGSQYIKLGACWQCPTCKLVMVTEGDLRYDSSTGNCTMQTIGRYAFYPYNENINTNGTIIYTPTSYGYCAQNSMDGYRFYLAN